MDKKPQFTVDWETFDSFLPWQKRRISNLKIEEPTRYLLDLLRRHQIKATWYCVGMLLEHRNLSYLVQAIRNDGHTIGDHTYYHEGNLKSFEPFRAPRWKGEKRLFSGGFWFRLMPYWWTKREVENTGVFFVHPHDVMLEHPECGLRTFDRRLGLKTSRDKLERLCREVEFA